MRYCRELLYDHRAILGSTVLLPVGSFEDHFEEPMVLDTLLALEVSCRAADICDALVAWPIGYSFSPGHARSVSLDEDMVGRLVGLVVEGLGRLGASRVVVVDGHYGHRVVVERVSASRGALYVNVWDLLVEEGFETFEKQVLFERMLGSYLRGEGGYVVRVLERIASRLAERLGCRV